MTPDEQRKLNSRLIDAGARGDTETVQTLLAQGANVHVKDDYALRMAASFGQAETVKVLLAVGANVHALNDDALCWAAYNDHTETVRVLAKHIFAPDSWREKPR